MSISTFAMRRSPVVFALVLLLMIFGLRSYFTLPAQEDPKITIREAVVTTQFPGLSPERMELLVTKTLEEAIRQIPEIREIRSTSRAGVSIIHVVAHQQLFELDQVWDELREKVEAVSSTLPQGAQAPVINDDFGDVAVVTAALTADGFALGEMTDIATHVRDQIYGVEGTKNVELHGVQEERIFVEASNPRLAELGLTTDALVAAVQEQNIIRPAGVIDTGARSFLVATTGNFDSIDDVRETLIPLPHQQGSVPLQDLARITRDTIDPPLSKAYFNGRPAIVFAVSMQDRQRVLEYGPRLRKRLQEIEATLPVGYQIDIVTYQADQVANAVYGVTSNVLQTLLIVLAVVILFLGLRVGLIVGSIVPAVMLITLAIMGFAGIPMERMSLATLVIALGLLVDNGIVVAEDFKRRLEDGASRDDALESTGRELAMPLLSSTLTTILVFLPLMLAEHEAGEYTRSISLVILISLLTSWVLAMTVTPVLCHRFMKTPEQTMQGRNQGGPFAIFERHYTGLLRRLLRIRIPFLIGMLMALIISGWALGKVPQRFFPASDRAQVLITLDLPADVTLRTTDETLRLLMPMLQDKQRFPYFSDFAAYAGYGGPRFVLSLAPLDPAPNKAFLVVNLDTIESMPLALAELRSLLLSQIPEIRARATDMFLGPSDPGVFHIQIKGPDADVIYAAAQHVEAVLRGVPGTIDVFHDWENRIPMLVVDIDQARARRNGVTSSDIAKTLSTYFSGQSISEYREGDDIFPIVARAIDGERSDIDRLKTIAVQRSSGSGTAPLAQVAEISLASDFAVIQREDLTRTVTIEGRPLAYSPEDLPPRIEPALDEIRATLPPGHQIEYDGVVTDSAQGKAALGANVPLCLAAMVLLLIAQFNSFLRPLIIIATIPLLIVGAAVGLHAMKADFGFMVILGLLSLAGIIINNSIVLIDRIDLERQQDVSGDTQSIVAASTRRLRPIVMTTVTTMLGLLPLILSRDPLFYGMATVIAFGLGIGTVMTLGVTPVLYALFFRVADPVHSSGDVSELKTTIQI